MKVLVTYSVLFLIFEIVLIGNLSPKSGSNQLGSEDSIFQKFAVKTATCKIDIGLNTTDTPYDLPSLQNPKSTDIQSYKAICTAYQKKMIEDFSNGALCLSNPNSTFNVTKEVQLTLGSGFVQKVEKSKLTGKCANELPVKPTSTTDTPTVILPGKTNWHLTGTPSGNSWLVREGVDSSNALTYGPYTNSLKKGWYKVDGVFKLDNVNGNNDLILTIDVFGSGKVIARKEIFRKNFTGSGSFTDFRLFFYNDNYSNLEFRSFWSGVGTVEHAFNVITPANEGDLGELWNSKAHFKLINGQGTSFPSGPNNEWRGQNTATVFIPKDGGWYVFNRQVSPRGAFPGCPGDVSTKMVVRFTSDKGKTFSNPVTVIDPKKGRYDECAAVDGSAFYDSETDTWHMLTQCLGMTGGWNGCHYYRKGSSPLGEFIPNPANPVIKGGDLWSQLCSGSGKSCPDTTNGEGTFQILYKRGGYFYFDFHGAEDRAPDVVYGYRGIAKTKNFVNMIALDTSDPDLTNDAYYSNKDCQKWNVDWKGGCVGGGQASSIISGDWLYTIIESPDLSISCPAGQKWDYGLVRTPLYSHTPSGAWDEYNQIGLQQFDKNPVVSHLNRNSSCPLQYASLFRDNDGIYLSYWEFGNDANTTLRIYQLMKGDGPLPVYNNPKWCGWGWCPDQP